MENRYQETVAWGFAPAGAFLVLLAAWVLVGTTLQRALPEFVRQNESLLLCVLLLGLTGADLALVFVQHMLDAWPLSRWCAAKRLLQIAAGLVAAGLGGLAGQLVIVALGGARSLAQSAALWPVLALLVLLLVYISALAFLTYQISSLHFRWLENRAAMLRKLETRYTTYLGNPLLRTVRAELDIRVIPGTHAGVDAPPADARGGPVRMKLRPETTLRSLYDPGQGARRNQVLIVGGPGAGKSAQLHLLGLALTKEAQIERAALLPVILDLATCDLDAESLEDWLSKAIGETYHVHGRIARRWVKRRQVLPLLDALDLIGDRGKRAHCIRILNAYATRYPDAPLVVCARHIEPESSGIRLRLPQTLHLDPLRDDAVEQALRGTKQDATGVASALADTLADNWILRDVLRTPVMLSLVLATYADRTAAPDYLLHAKDASELQHGLFRDFVAHLLAESGSVPEKVTAEKSAAATMESVERPLDTERVLAWMGYQLREHGLFTLYLDELQRDWLAEAKGQKAYDKLVMGTCWLIELIVGLSLGLFAALAITWIYGIGNGAIVTLLFGPTSNAGVGVVLRVVVGLVGGVGVGLGIAAAVNAASRIMLAERAGFIANRRRSATATGLIAGFAGSLSAIIVAGLGIGLPHALMAGIVVGLLVGEAVEWSGAGVAPTDDQHPGQGVSRSARAALESFVLYSLVGLALGGVLGGFVFWMAIDVVTGKAALAQQIGQMGTLAGALTGVMCIGLFVGVDVALRQGGAAALQHIALRVALIRSGTVPRHLVRWLEAAGNCGLLCRAGSGYQFAATLLRDYFAEIYDMSGRESPGQTIPADAQRWDAGRVEHDDAPSPSAILRYRVARVVINALVHSH